MTANSLQRIEELARTIETAPDSRMRANALELKQAVLEFHGEALEKILALCNKSGDAGQEIIHAMSQDALISGVLCLHNLHPESTLTRVHEAVRRLNSILSKDGTKVDFVALSADGVLQLKAQGVTRSSDRVFELIEDSVLSAAPEIAGISVEGLPQKNPSGFVPITSLSKNSAA